MPAHVTTPATLSAQGLGPGLVELRTLERRLDARLAALDARVEKLLHAAGPYTDDEVSQVDTLCAAIAELAELREAARADILRQRADRTARRSGVRSWG